MPEIIANLSAALGSRYDVQRALGSGGMATVYLARDRKHDRDVALKVLRPDLAEAIGGERFLREIEIADRALRRVVELNPGFGPAWQHLGILNYQRNPAWSDTAWRRAGELGVPMFRENEVAVELVAQWRAKILNGQEPDDSLLSAIIAADDGTPRGVVAGIVRHVVRSGLGGLPTAARLSQRLPARPTNEILRAQIAAQRGAWDSALVHLRRGAEMDAASTVPYSAAVMLAWIGAVPPEEVWWFRNQAAAAAADALDSAGIAWGDGMLAVAGGDGAALAAARSRLSTLDAGTRLTSYMERALAAFQLWMDGRQGAAVDSLAALEWERTNGVRHLSRRVADLPSNQALTVVNRLAATRWLAAEGDPAQALRMSQWVEAWPNLGQLGPLVEPLVRLDQGRIAEQLGRRELARTYYQLFLDRFDMPQSATDSGLVAEAREALRRLTGEGR